MMAVACEPQADLLIRLFNTTFGESDNTYLVAGDGEPVYRPASNRRSQHQVIFAHGFARSALHEVAHWCLAGKVRRQLTDFGYWYAPDGRSPELQAVFEQVEVGPQAVEWYLSLAAGITFEISVDNLSGSQPPNRVAFLQAVIARAYQRAEHGWPPRAVRFAAVLQAHFQQPPVTLARLQAAAATMLSVERARIAELS